MSIQAREVTGSRFAASVHCPICDGAHATGDTALKAYHLSGARHGTGGGHVVVHGSCLNPAVLAEFIGNALEATEAYMAARDKAEDVRQGVLTF